MINPVFISIHALREEGDLMICRGLDLLRAISIHALREEGDHIGTLAGALFTISIHALREEGDLFISSLLICIYNFNPRPPRGGRRLNICRITIIGLFQSTPSARRATIFFVDFS